MPLYVYETIPEDGDEPERFELFQRMADEPLTHHPVSGLPVQRVITAPNLPLQHGDRAEAQRLSNANLSRLGFTRYEKAGNGVYEKTAGDGPKVIHRD